LRFFDLFAGVGGFRIGFEREGYRCIGFCEIDKHARKLYKAYFKTEEKGEFEWDDILTLNPEDLPDFEVLTAGLPCQPFSVVGKRRGLKDGRAYPLWSAMFRIIERKRPIVCVFENVKGLLSADRGWAFAYLLYKMDAFGYDAEWTIFNSKAFGVPQNRERIFAVFYFREKCRGQIFPFTENDKVYYNFSKAKEEIHSDSELAGTLTARQYSNWNGNFVYDPYNKKLKKEKVAGALRTNYSNGNSWIVELPNSVFSGQKRNKIQEAKPIKVGYVGKTDCQANRVYSLDGIAITLLSNGGGRGAKTGLYLTEETKVRRLTPLECFRLQGFSDDIYYKAKEIGISDVQLYKMTGNAVTVQIPQSIARKLKKVVFRREE